MVRRSRRLMTALVAGGVVVSSAGVALADTIVVSNASVTVAPGGSDSVTLGIQATSETGDVNGCNAGGDGNGTNSDVTISFTSDNPDVPAPAPVTVSACDDPKTPGIEDGAVVTVRAAATATDAETATLTATATGGKTVVRTTKQGTQTILSSFSTATINVTVDAPPPPAPTNSAPTVVLQDVTANANYSKGLVPTALCVVTDAEDGPSSYAATLSAVSGTYTADGIGSQTASCAAYQDSGGAFAAAVAGITYNIVDPSAPSISGVRTPADPDGLNGWYKSNVALNWTVGDPESPNSLVKTGCVDQNVTADQAATSYSCTATSAGGSTGPVTFSIKRDGTAPTVAYTSAAGTAGANDWYKSPVTATFTGTDALSGPASATQSVTSTTDGAAVLLSSPAFTDNAGNTRAGSAASQPFKIDTVAPVVSDDQSISTWSNAASVTSQLFTASDATSGIADGDKSFRLQVSAESTRNSAGAVVPTSVTRDVTDAAGHTSTATFSALIDRTKPTVGFTGGPADNASYWTTGVPTAPTCSGNDALSGLATTGGCVISGYSAQAGTHTVTATATDEAGNTASESRTYTVRNMTSTGFYAPVDMGGILNTVKGGSTVPLKFNIQIDGVQQTATSLVTAFTANKTDCTLAGADDIEIVTTGSTSLRYDSTAGHFIQNWKTPTGAGTCYKATATLADGDTISALFKLK